MNTIRRIALLAILLGLGAALSLLCGCAMPTSSCASLFRTKEAQAVFAGKPQAFDPAMLKAGDLMLYAPKDIPGYLIAIKTGRLKSHIELYIGGGRSIAARQEGVNVYPVRIDAQLASVRRHPDWQKFDTNAAMRAVSPLLGQSYEIPALFAFFCPWHVAERTLRVCSPVACLGLRGGGLECFNPDLPNSGVTPAAFFETGALQTIWRNPTIDRAFTEP